MNEGTHTKLIVPRNEWEDKFWDLEKKYNLMLDNENYEDLMKFAKEYETIGENKQRLATKQKLDSLIEVAEEGGFEDEVHALQCAKTELP